MTNTNFEWPNEKFIAKKLKNYKTELNGVIQIRQHLLETSTISRLIVQPLGVESKYICDSLEDKYRDLSKEKKIPGQTAIPYGLYYCRNTMYTKHNIMTPYFYNVQHFVGIRCHSGQTIDHTEGCILPGYNVSSNFQESSRTAFAELMKIIGGWDEYYWEIIEQKIDI